MCFWKVRLGLLDMCDITALSLFTILGCIRCGNFCVLGGGFLHFENSGTLVGTLLLCFIQKTRQPGSLTRYLTLFMIYHIASHNFLIRIPVILHSQNRVLLIQSWFCKFAFLVHDATSKNTRFFFELYLIFLKMGRFRNIIGSLFCVESWRI